MVYRAYSLLHVKAVDGDRRVLTGMATTPAPDRVGDVVEPRGVKFKNPLPLLLFHDNTLPVGEVRFGKATDEGIPFTASIPDIPEAGRLKDRVDEAWQSVKYGLIKGVSIGFRVLDDGMELLRSGGIRFTATEVLELSLVPVPANAEAVISTIKSLDAPYLAASGTGQDGVVPRSAGVTAPVVTLARKDATPPMKSITDRIKEFEATRQAKAARMTEIMDASEGSTLDAAQSTEYDGLRDEVKAIDEHLVRLTEMESVNKATARPVSGSSPAAASASRGGEAVTEVRHSVSVRPNVDPGIEFARALMCKVASFMTQGSVSPVDFAKSRYPDSQRIQAYLKATVPAGTTTDAAWASPLVDQTNLAGEFIEFLRPQTIVGKFGTGGIPSLRRVPFNVRMVGQTSGGNAWWVGQGAPKPVTSFGFEATTLLYTKIAAISVITDELARFSSPSAEMLVRDGLRDALVEQLDRDFVDPSMAGSAAVSPASITNGLTALTSAGATADNARTDIGTLLSEFITNNINPTNLVLIMPNTLALALSLMRNSLGQKEFQDLGMNGGLLEGIPVITSQYAADVSNGGGNLVVAVNASDIFLADDGQVTVDASREASIQMLDNPTNNSSGTATTSVSMWQTNSLALRAERYINWARRRTGAVSYMDDVNWGSIGSPA